MDFSPIQRTAHAILSELSTSLGDIPACVMCHIDPAHSEGIVSVTIGEDTASCQTLTFLLRGGSLCGVETSDDDNPPTDISPVPTNEVSLALAGGIAGFVGDTVARWLVEKTQP